MFNKKAYWTDTVKENSPPTTIAQTQLYYGVVVVVVMDAIDKIDANPALFDDMPIHNASIIELNSRGNALFGRSHARRYYPYSIYKRTLPAIIRSGEDITFFKGYRKIIKAPVIRYT